MVFSCFCVGKDSTVESTITPAVAPPVQSKQATKPAVNNPRASSPTVDVPPTPEPSTIAPLPRDNTPPSQSPARTSEDDIDVWSLVDPSSAACKAPRTILTATAAKAIAAQHDARHREEAPMLTELRSLVRAISATVGDGALSPHTPSEAPSTTSRGASPVGPSLCLSTATSAGVYHDAMSATWDTCSSPRSPVAQSYTGEHPAVSPVQLRTHAIAVMEVHSPAPPDHEPPVRLGSHRLFLEDSGPSEEGTTHSSVEGEAPEVSMSHDDKRRTMVCCGILHKYLCVAKTSHQQDRRQSTEHYHTPLDSLQRLSRRVSDIVTHAVEVAIHPHAHDKATLREAAARAEAEAHAAAEAAQQRRLCEYDAALVALCNRWYGAEAGCMADMPLLPVAPWNQHAGYLVCACWLHATCEGALAWESERFIF